MDLSRQLKNAIATGNLRFGQRQAIDACARGEAKVVILAANCPTDFTDELHANHPEVTKFRSGMVNRELGIACGKPLLSQPSALSMPVTVNYCSSRQILSEYPGGIFPFEFHQRFDVSCRNGDDYATFFPRVSSSFDFSDYAHIPSCYSASCR